MACTIRTLSLILPLIATPAYSQVNLHDKKFEEIISKYVFIGDFNIKPETRHNATEEIFWRYPIKIADPVFDPGFEFPKTDQAGTLEELPPTLGSGRAIQHLNRGRALFLEGKYNEAKSTWLGARSRYGLEYPFHRRTDYFIALAFLNLARTAPDAHTKRLAYNNAATFLSWAFQQKKDIADPALERLMPKGLNALAAIYYNYGRFAGAFGVADEGLNYLRRTGRTEKRSSIRQILAESFIKNRDYLDAVSELDVALRQEPTKQEASNIFTRVGDIYFDLNNFDLAEDAYALGNRIDVEAERIKPVNFALRGESLFWLGRFKEALQMFNYALDRESHKNSVGTLNTDYAALATLRIADSWLAQGSYGNLKKTRQKFKQTESHKDDSKKAQQEYLAAKKAFDEASAPFQQARLSYFKHIEMFPSHDTTVYAKIRLACLELPEYEGNNVNHARNLLDEIKANKAKVDTSAIAEEAMHLAWSCHVASFASRERTKDMVGRVKEFYVKYPRSRFLEDLIEPVRDVQSNIIYEYFAKGDLFTAIAFFETNRKNLFPTIDDKLKKNLFLAYIDTYQPKSGGEFWTDPRSTDDTLLLVRKATLAAENLELADSKVWRTRNESLAKMLDKRSVASIPNTNLLALYLTRILNSKGASIHYPWILKLSDDWSNHNATLMCQISFPLLMKSWQQKPAQATREKFLGLLDNHLKEIFAFDKNCGYSLVEFESQVLAKDPIAFKDRIMGRTYIPIDEYTVPLLWSLAETFRDDGDNDNAKQIWTFLVQQGPSNLPQVRYAKLRLENKKLEFEKLWD